MATLCIGLQPLWLSYKIQKNRAAAYLIFCRPPLFFAIFFFLFTLFFGSLRWAWHFGRMGVHHPHFLKLAPTLGDAQSSIPHGAWRFHFFPDFILLKL
jgi:hypothetical protein